MNPQLPSPVVDSIPSQKKSKGVAKKAAQPEQSNISDDDPHPAAVAYGNDLLDRVTQLSSQDKLALMRQLITQLKPTHLRTIVEFGQQTLADRQHDKLTSATIHRETCLLLKKDYSYQERGLSEPTQYYVYLRRRKPKLDRYIGALFYVPQGCVLSYVPDGQGRILFQPPHSTFQLTDSKKLAGTQIVRLVALEPPPADYTFTKQQADTPEIYLRLEYLEPLTFQPVAEELLPFPSCMHEGGALDRYRWDVALIQLPAENESAIPPAGLNAIADRNQLHRSKPESSNRDLLPTPQSAKSASVLQLPGVKSAPFYLHNSSDVSQVLERMQLWVVWSEKATPQAKWTIAQSGDVYTLMNANSKRSILSVATDQSTVTLHGSLPVIVKWFHDLSLAVSQSQNQRRYSFAQLKMAHNLFVEMSLPQNDPIALLKKLFGVEFGKNQSPSV